MLAVGSPRLQADELADRRYGLSDLLDELAGSTDPGETFVICWNVIVESAELAFLLAGSWLGTGKWFLRELRAADPVLADWLIEARDDHGAGPGRRRRARPCRRPPVGWVSQSSRPDQLTAP